MDGFSVAAERTVQGGRGLSDGGRTGAEQIEALSAAEQRTLIVELTSYAAWLIRRYAGRLPRGAALPDGEDAGTLAVDAIARVLDGCRRPWDPAKEPSLLAYLKSVVKSIFTSEILPAAERDPEVPGLDRDGNDVGEDVASDTPQPGDEDPEAKVERRKAELLALFDVYEDQLVLMCMMDEQTKAADIAATLDLPVDEVYRIKRKIKRRLEDWTPGD